MGKLKKNILNSRFKINKIVYNFSQLESLNRYTVILLEILRFQVHKAKD